MLLDEGNHVAGVSVAIVRDGCLGAISGNKEESWESLWTGGEGEVSREGGGRRRETDLDIKFLRCFVSRGIKFGDQHRFVLQTQEWTGMSCCVWEEGSSRLLLYLTHLLCDLFIERSKLLAMSTPRGIELNHGVLVGVCDEVIVIGWSHCDDLTVFIIQLLLLFLLSLWRSVPNGLLLFPKQSTREEELHELLHVVGVEVFLHFVEVGVVLDSNVGRLLV
jgi:hypothetical protein